MAGEMAAASNKRSRRPPSSSESDRPEGKRSGSRRVQLNQKKNGERENDRGEGISGSSSSSNNRRHVRISKKKVEYCRGLPTELMKEVFLHCDSGLLRNLCLVSKAFYLEALPLLYQDFAPTDWTDLLTLKRHLQDGIGPACLDRQDVARSIARRVQTIKIPALKFHGSQREIAFLQQETLHCLEQVIKRVHGLRAFHLNVLTLTDSYAELWKTLQNYHLQELVMSEKSLFYNASLIGLESELWNMKNLSRIDLSICTVDGQRRHQLLTGLAKLLQESPNLKKLKLDLNNGTHSDVVDFEQLFELQTYSHLEALDLENIQCQDGGKIRKFLASMESLKKLRFVHGHEEGVAQHSPIDWKSLGSGVAHNHHILLPALIDVDVTGLSNLEEVCLINTPKTLRNVAVICSGTTSNGPQVPDGLSFLRDCTSVEELHLAIYGSVNFDVSLPVTVSILNCIPTSVKRLAIRMSSTTEKRINATPRKNCLQALSRLVNLESLILPWTLIVYFNSAQDTQLQAEGHIEPGAMAKIVENRARQMAKTLSKKHPKLRFVSFESDSGTNKTGDPLRPAEFLCDGVKVESGRSFVVEITRCVKRTSATVGKNLDVKKEASPEPTSKTRKGRNSSQRKTSSDAISGAGDESDGKTASNSKNESATSDDKSIPSAGAVVQVKLKIVSHTCICENCWVGGTFLRDSEYEVDSDELEDFMMEYGYDGGYDDDFLFGSPL